MTCGIWSKRMEKNYHQKNTEHTNLQNLISFLYAELYNFKLEQIPPQKEKEIAVSSTKIRNLLIDGDIKTANQFLDHNFQK